MDKVTDWEKEDYWYIRIQEIFGMIKAKPKPRAVEDVHVQGELL